MADLVSADVTYVEAGYPFRRITEPGRYVNKVTLTFGDNAKTYPAGGLPLNAFSLGMPAGQIESVQIVDQTTGDRLDWMYDAVTTKLRAWKTPVIEPIIEETVTVASNVGVLKQLPCHVFMVHATAGGTTGAFKPRLSTSTPATTEVAINYATGTLTFLGADAVTECAVSYLPLAALAKPSDLVIEEAMTVTANKGTLANQACLVGVFESTAGGVTGLNQFRSAGVTPATKQVAVNFNDAGSTTTGTFLAGDAVTAAKATYVKVGAFPTVVDETITLTVTNTTNSAGTFARFGVPGYGVYFDTTAGSTNTHVGAKPSTAVNSLANATWSFSPYAPPRATLLTTDSVSGSGVLAHDAAGPTSGKMTYAKVPSQGLASNGQQSLEELRSPLLDTVPPTTLVLYVTGF